MAPINPNEARAVFLRTFKETAPYKHRYEVWRDFITLTACALHNGFHKEEQREAEYLRVIADYKPDDQQRLASLLGALVTLLDAEPRDILGPLYMELEIANKDAGQFFTPPELSDLIARINMEDAVAMLETQPFITLSEPACGAGGMVLSAVKVLIEQGHDPAQKLWVQCVDVDRVAALMCYIQLTLWHVPAQVIVGNTLSLETREVWYTPAHHLGFWDSKLRSKEDVTSEDDLASQAEQVEPDDQLARADPVYEEFQIEWQGQCLTIRHCPTWLGDETAHLEITSADRSAHPISETGYRSHFIRPELIEEEGGPVAYVMAWLHSLDDGKPKQLSLF